MNDKVFDVVVAGGGVAGLLAAMKIRRQCPQLNIALLEKEKNLGGRIRSTDQSQDQWGCGLNNISKKLYDFWQSTLNEYPECQSLENLGAFRQNNVGVMAAGNVTELPLVDLFSEKGARAIGGVAAMRDWSTNFIPILDKYDPEVKQDKVFSQSWKAGRKNPAAVVLENMVPAFGIPDIWSSCTQAIIEKADEHTSEVYEADWNKVIGDFIEKLNDSPEDSERLQILTNCLVVGAKFEDNEWTFQTEKGVFRSKALVIAQPPWQVLPWLHKSAWPTALLPIALKAKPVSLVVISDVINNNPEYDIPGLLLVPAETAQIAISTLNKSISYMATLDYEVSFEAPAVVKAIKRLKRAKKRLLATYPDLNVSGDHIMLLSVGWGQPLSFNDSQLVAKMDKNDINTSSLMFCGDSYGSSFRGDDNIISSVTKCCEMLCNKDTENNGSEDN